MDRWPIKLRLDTMTDEYGWHIWKGRQSRHGRTGMMTVNHIGLYRDIFDPIIDKIAEARHPFPERTD